MRRRILRGRVAWYDVTRSRLSAPGVDSGRQRKARRGARTERAPRSASVPRDVGKPGSRADYAGQRNVQVNGGFRSINDTKNTAHLYYDI